MKNLKAPATTWPTELASVGPATKYTGLPELEIAQVRLNKPFQHEAQLLSAQNRTGIIAKLEEFIKWTAELSVTDNSRRVYESRAKQFLQFIKTKAALLAEPTLPAAFSAVFQQFCCHLHSVLELKTASINNYIRFARMFARFCSWDTTTIPAMVHGTDSCASTSFDDFEQYLNTVSLLGSPRDKALITLLICSRLQISEILCLRFTEVSICNQTVVICKANKNPIHLPDIADNALGSIANWLDMRATASDTSGTTLLFPGNNKLPLSRTACDSLVRKYGWKCGIVASVRALRKAFLASAPPVQRMATS